MRDADIASSEKPLTFLCLASYDKGQRTMEELKRQGCRTYLLTSLSLKEKTKWPSESLEEIFYMEDVDHEWNLQHMLLGISHLCRTVELDRIIALDDFDVEKGAFLREHLRIPGLGETPTRYFRDKLAMRMRAAAYGIPVPPFTATINNGQISNFLDRVPGPWVLKPRLLAGALGIKKFAEAQSVWDQIGNLGDEQSFFVLERFVPGDIFHVDSIWFGGQMVFAIASAYGTPPLELTTGGGVFTTQILDYAGELANGLKALNESVLKAFEFQDGVSHTEFIRAHDDGQYYFLETSARVGGASISDLIEAASGINLWEEWAKIEIASAKGLQYSLPAQRGDYAGLLVSLARQEWPDTSGFNDPEVVWRMDKKNHIGLIVQSRRRERVEQLLSSYAHRVRNEFQASAPPREKPGE